MSNINETQIVGSVVQRTLVPRNISGFLSVVAVPWEDCAPASLPLRQFASQLFGVADSDLLDESEYGRAVALIRSPDFWREVEHEYAEYGPPFHWFAHEVYRALRRWQMEVPEESGRALAEHVVVCQLMNWSDTGVVQGWLWPSPFLPPPLRQERWNAFIRERGDVSPEAFSMAARTYSLALSAPARVRSVLPELYRYHIPFGHSPETQSETLRNVIERAKTIVVAPLFAGALGASTLISTGQYVTALQCAATGGAATLLLIGSIALSDVVIDLLSKKRARVQG